ncbi:MAG: GntR family transcriptional regulator [Victivallaceae bacterium]|nr:GntR family transcriptional regulator [Victivallaceae bacterium]
MKLSPRRQVIAKIRQWLEDGTLSPGDELPSENLLADTLCVARGTVRFGIAELLEQGLLRKNGRKIHAAERPHTNHLFRRSIALIGTTDAASAVRLQDTGYLAAIYGGAIAAAANAGTPALTLDIGHINCRDIGELCQNRPAGIIFFAYGTLTDEQLDMLKRLASSGIPAVAYSADKIFSDMDIVTSDHASGCEMLVDMLVKTGRKKICCLIPENRPESWAQDRLDGYRRAMAKHGLPPLALPTTMPFEGDWQGWSKSDFEYQCRCYAGCLIELFRAPKERPDALLARNDWDVPLIAGALRILGLEPGRDVVIAGYDNKFSDCAWNAYEPYLPEFTIDKNNRYNGEMLFETLKKRLDGTLTGPPIRIRVKPLPVHTKSE